MKNILSIIILSVILSHSVCTPNNTHVSLNDSNSEPTATNAYEKRTIISDATQSTHGEDYQLPLPQEDLEFSFLSGAGAWRTIITLNRDGTFTGWYLDSEMGDIGEDYPKGSAYTCTFFGKFENIEKVNEYSYKMTLTDLKTEKTVGEEWIEDEIRYVASSPYGLNAPNNEQECTEFIFFLPDTPIEKVPEEFLSWWPYRYTQETEPKATLSCYGILNVTTNVGFFNME